MSTLTNYQTIPGNGGKPALVVIPFADFIKLPGAVTPARFPMQWLAGALWMRPIRWNSLRIEDLLLEIRTPLFKAF